MINYFFTYYVRRDVSSNHQYFPQILTRGFQFDLLLTISRIHDI